MTNQDRQSSANIKRIDYLSDPSEINPLNDNIDVRVLLEDGREFVFVVATPNSVFWCMDNEGIDYFFGLPFLFVRSLTTENVAKAIHAIVADGRYLEMYGKQLGG